jgi:hypothetical protein
VESIDGDRATVRDDCVRFVGENYDVLDEDNPLRINPLRMFLMNCARLLPEERRITAA